MIEGTEAVSPEATIPETDAPETTWQHEAGLDGDVNFEKFNSVADLGKSYTELSSMMGNSIRFPSKEAGEEDVAAFNEKMLGRGFHRAPDSGDAESTREIQRLLGLPADAKDYKFEEIDGFADDDSDFRTVAHEAGLTRGQAESIHNWMGSNVSSDNKALGESSAKEMDAYKREQGTAFEHNMQMKQNLASNLEERVPGVSAYLDSMAENGYDANMLRLFDVMVEMSGESSAEPMLQGNHGLTKMQAQQNIEDARGNPNHWFNQDRDLLTDKQRAESAEWQRVAYS